MLASFFSLVFSSVDVDGTSMSTTSSWDQFVCRVWLTRLPLWSLLVASTYGILVTAFERYIAVIHPIWYKVRSGLVSGILEYLPIDASNFYKSKTTKCSLSHQLIAITFSGTFV